MSAHKLGKPPAMRVDREFCAGLKPSPSSKKVTEKRLIVYLYTINKHISLEVCNRFTWVATNRQMAKAFTKNSKVVHLLLSLFTGRITYPDNLREQADTCNQMSVLNEAQPLTEARMSDGRCEVKYRPNLRDEGRQSEIVEALSYV